MLPIMIDGVHSRDHAGVVAGSLSGVRIDIVKRKVTAGDVQSDPMAFLESVGGTQKIDGDFADFSRLQKLGLFQAVPKSRPYDAIGQQHIVAPGVVVIRENSVRPCFHWNFELRGSMLPL